ncbi:hypothetical protein RA274_27620, partial [Pseudomonas syringae pv. tagetis]|uniref:hypothetical protein n=1 Tax=Pseudomonas syringae group genomosp. 7 TaxID=251699 RepID=UPI00376FF3C1
MLVLWVWWLFGWSVVCFCCVVCFFFCWLVVFVVGLVVVLGVWCVCVWVGVGVLVFVWVGVVLWFGVGLWVWVVFFGCCLLGWGFGGVGFCVGLVFVVWVVLVAVGGFWVV